jgi:hypothetical protein
MSGFIQFTDGDWSWSSGMTEVVFDLLVERLSDTARAAEIADLRDNNVLMLDLRSPAEEPLVELIVDHLNDYVATHFDADARQRLEKGFSELHRLAAAQHVRNQSRR